jgi:hypothetical protein
MGAGQAFAPYIVGASEARLLSAIRRAAAKRQAILDALDQAQDQRAWQRQTEQDALANTRYGEQRAHTAERERITDERYANEPARNTATAANESALRMSEKMTPASLQEGVARGFDFNNPASTLASALQPQTIPGETVQTVPGVLGSVFPQPTKLPDTQQPGWTPKYINEQEQYRKGLAATQKGVGEGSLPPSALCEYGYTPQQANEFLTTGKNANLTARTGNVVADTAYVEAKRKEMSKRLALAQLTQKDMAKYRRDELVIRGKSVNAAITQRGTQLGINEANFNLARWRAMADMEGDWKKSTIQLQRDLDTAQKNLANVTQSSNFVLKDPKLNPDVSSNWGPDQAQADYWGDRVTGAQKALTEGAIRPNLGEPPTLGAAAAGTGGAGKNWGIAPAKIEAIRKGILEDKMNGTTAGTIAPRLRAGLKTWGITNEQVVVDLMKRFYEGQ